MNQTENAGPKKGKNMSDYKIINGTLLLFAEGEVKTEEKTIYIKDGRITFQPFSEGEEFEVIDARRRLIMPGLINMHTHSYMTMMCLSRNGSSTGLCRWRTSFPWKRLTGPPCWAAWK